MALNLNDFTIAVFVPGEHCVIDVMHPETGKTAVNAETLEQVRKRYPTAQTCLYEDWIATRAAAQDAPVTWAEITEERYDEMLNVLPPVNYGRGGFQVGEPADHHAGNGRPRFAAFIASGGKHYESSRPMTSTEFRAFVASGCKVEA